MDFTEFTTRTNGSFIFLPTEDMKELPPVVQSVLYFILTSFKLNLKDTSQDIVIQGFNGTTKYERATGQESCTAFELVALVPSLGRAGRFEFLNFADPERGVLALST